jgi:A/G-specific adenine glycosylase
MLQQSLINSADDIFLQNSQEIRARFEREGLSSGVIDDVRNCIWSYHTASRRSFPWREVITPYRVVVSEIMLQQTQTYRVEPKFIAFVERFPDFATLAQAPFDEVLRYWKGLGYNRRAQNLQLIAQRLLAEHDGKVPVTPEAMLSLPGIGKATAASICAFTHNQSTLFLETNIRTLLIYFFFDATETIHDKELFPIAEKLLDTSRPREWYYALMDVGVLIKKRVGNLTRLSKHYTKQSRFEGSRRQIRGKILELLLEVQVSSLEELEALVNDKNNRTISVINELVEEKFLVFQDNLVTLKK